LFYQLCGHYRLSNVFPSAERNKTHTLPIRTIVHIDARGCPNWEEKTFTSRKLVPKPRDPNCQVKVARLGKAEFPKKQFDGGHMIASNLGGYGKRANLVPQESNFNRGTWKSAELRIASCIRNSNPAVSKSNPLIMRVRASYPTTRAMTPSVMTMKVTYRGKAISISFLNTFGGGAGAHNKYTVLKNWLTARGC